MNESLKNIFSLSTTRGNNFSDKKVSDDDFNTLIKSGVQAPNASNRQSYSIIVIDEKTKKELGLKGDRVLLFIIDFYRHECLSKHLGKNISFDHFQPFLTGVIDVSLAIQNIVVAANSMDIGYLVTNDTYTRDLDKLFEIFKLPKKGCFPLLYLCLGYPKEKKTAHKYRLDMKHIVHYGQYNDYSKDEIEEIVQEYDTVVGLELFPKWRDKGYGAYLDWFYDKWTPALESKEKSNKVLDAIKREGFINSD